LSVDDSIATALTRNGALDESGAASDQVTSQANLGAAVSESGSAADALAAALQAAGAVAESATASDTVAAGLIAPAAFAEAGSASDAVDSTAVMGAAIAEAASAGDSTSATQVRSGALDETGSAADAVAAQLDAVGTLAETADASDVVTASSANEQVLDEPADAQDQVSSTAVVAGAVSEPATAAADRSSAGRCVRPLSAFEPYITIDPADDAIEVVQTEAPFMPLFEGACVGGEARCGDDKTFGRVFVLHYAEKLPHYPYANGVLWIRSFAVDEIFRADIVSLADGNNVAATIARLGCQLHSVAETIEQLCNHLFKGSSIEMSQFFRLVMQFDQPIA
jgi:hypothetical protein